MNLAQPKVIWKAWDLVRTWVGSPAEQEAPEQISLAKSSLVLALRDSEGQSSRLSQAWRASDRDEQALCMGKDLCPTPTYSSQTEGAHGYAPSQ